ncbi:MAG: MarR family winged helix-turn-helix transcriptional regulator [Thermoplasmatota archaeon]
MGAPERDELLYGAWNALKGASWAVFSKIADESDRLAATPAQVACVHFALQSGEPTTPQDLARIMKVTPATVNGFLNNLEEQGLITRSRESEDRRVVYVRPTPKGKAVAQEWGERFRQNLKAVFEPLTDEELRSLATTLARVAPPIVGPPGGFAAVMKHQGSMPLRPTPSQPTPRARGRARTVRR